MSNAVPADRTPPAQSPHHARRWWILAVVVFGLIVVILDTTVLNVALKTIADPRRGIGASQTDLEWALNSYTLVFAGLLITFGALGDRLGHKRVLVSGMVVFTIGSLIAGYAHGAAQLIVGRTVMGAGGAAIMPATLAIISHVFEPQERPKAIGIWGASVGVGAAVGPIVGGALITETIFAYPGLGYLIYNSIKSLDFPTIQGSILLIIISVASANFVMDLVYPLIDPRIRHGATARM